jgi:hypothetical protein
MTHSVDKHLPYMAPCISLEVIDRYGGRGRMVNNMKNGRSIMRNG